MAISESVIVDVLKDELKGVVKVSINHPKVHNALDDNIIEQLTQNFEELGQDTSVRVIVLGSIGPTFSAGADLNWMKRVAKLPLTESLAEAKKLSCLLDQIDRCPKATIACIQGGAFGGGVGLIAACDIAIAVENSVFCLSEVKVGLIPAMISPYLINAIGQRQARRYVLTADRISPAEALRMGLIHQVVGEGELEASVESMATSILHGSPAAITASKELIRFVESRPIDEAIHEETAQRLATVRSSVEGQEGMEAFLTKRRPAWVP